MRQRDKILTAAEDVFRREGFRGVGVDRVVEAAGVSTRTLYKAAGSKAALARRVLERRHERFMAALQGDGVGGVFDALDHWVASEGACGCLFLRAVGEYAAHDATIATVALTHKRIMADEIARRVRLSLGRDDADVAAVVLLLYEGAVAASVYRGREVVATARRAAEASIAAARTP
jgi:AcrR family transcriptional regulator